MTLEDLGDEEDNWFCSVCVCIINCLGAINDIGEYSFDTVDEVFVNCEEESSSSEEAVDSALDAEAESDDDDFEPESSEVVA